MRWKTGETFAPRFDSMYMAAIDVYYFDIEIAGRTNHEATETHDVRAGRGGPHGPDPRTAGEASAQEKRFISIGTGGPTGVYFVVGNSVCRMVHKEAAEGRKSGRKHGIRCAAPSTGGSTYNIGQICQGELDFGVAQSDWQFHAVNGSSEKVTNCRACARSSPCTASPSI